MLRRARKENPDAIIVAMGCFIESNKDNPIPGICGRYEFATSYLIYKDRYESYVEFYADSTFTYFYVVGGDTTINKGKWNIAKKGNEYLEDYWIYVYNWNYVGNVYTTVFVDFDEKIHLVNDKFILSCTPTEVAVFKQTK